MKKIALILVLMCCFSCKNEKQNLTVDANDIKEETQKPEYDYSKIPKDTLIVSGKEIVFFLPKKQEFEIIKNEENSFIEDSLYKYQIPRVKQYLKFPKNIKITISNKRIIGIDEGHRIRYYDRLDYFKSNYGMLMMYNKTFNFVKGYKTEEELYSKIDNFYRDNLRFEKNIARKYVIAQNGLNVREENGKISGKYNYAEIVNIIDFTKDTIVVDDNGNIIKDVRAIVKWKQNGRTKKRYVFNGFLGEKEDVKIFEDQICYGNVFDDPRLYDNPDYTYPECLNEYFDFKLISQNKFKNIAEINTDFYKKNTLVKITKNEDQTENISLPLKDSTLVFNSKMDYNESSHSFYGDVEFLNQYLMYHVYYKAEDAYFSFIDKTSGKRNYMFQGFPNISPDKKRIVSFHYDIYDNEPYIQVFKINSDKTIDFEKGFRFTYWAHHHESEIKWLSNTEFVMAIEYKGINGTRDFNPQYLKVNLKF
jgi:sulfur carrier protein ThiS